MRRTQAERSAATQSALLTAARRLWGERGYAEVSTPEIAEAAGVTRGAMYHQFPDKGALFVSVLEAVEAEVIDRLGAAIVAAQPKTPADALHAAADAWLEIASEPEVRQLVLVDAPSILGWAGFREISQRYGLGATEELLNAAIEAGQLRPQPVRTLATVLVGALDEAAMAIANADDMMREKEHVRAIVHDLIDGLLRRPPAKAARRQRPPAARRHPGGELL